MTLDKLEIGKTAVIRKVNGEGALRCRLLDMGLIPGTKVMIRKVAPMGDPIELHIRGYELTVRRGLMQKKLKSNRRMRRRQDDFCTGWKSELWQDDAV